VGVVGHICAWSSGWMAGWLFGLPCISTLVMPKRQPPINHAVLRRPMHEDRTACTKHRESFASPTCETSGSCRPTSLLRVWRCRRQIGAWQRLTTAIGRGQMEDVGLKLCDCLGSALGEEQRIGYDKLHAH
jgi:hypothetical protein